MFKSLWFKLVGAFAAVIAVMVVVVAVVANAATARQFDRYVVGSGQVWAQALAPRLAEEYAAQGDWSGAQDLLTSPLTQNAVAGGEAGYGQGGPGAGQGQGQGPGLHAGMQGMMGPASPGDVWGRVGMRLVLADAGNTVVADTGQTMIGEHLSAQVIQQGTAIEVNGQQVGTLLLVNPVDTSPLRVAFLQATSRAVLLAGLAAGAVALAMGTLLFVIITRPLRQLQVAAQTLAGGEMGTRVPVHSGDELGKVAEAFNQMAARLEQQQQLRQQMVADIAHELRTPISVIQGTLEAMLDGVLRPAPGELRGLHAETQRLARLVTDLRMLSLADAGQLTLEHGAVDLAAVVTGVVGRMQPLADSRGVALGADIAPGVPPVDGDSDRLAQVVTNLIDNALRYTPAGGRVTVRVDRGDGRVLVKVSDTGPGIAPEDIPFLFERFWRGDRSRNRHSGGSGLGLAIVKQLVTLHGGDVAVESQAGQGSTFVVSLPLAA